MSKMNDLSIEGVTDLHSYGVGFEAGQEREQKLIVEALQYAYDNAPAYNEFTSGLLAAIKVVNGEPIVYL